MLKRLGNTLQPALQCGRAVRLPRPSLRLALSALATAAGTTAVLLASQQIDPYRPGLTPTTNAAATPALARHEAASRGGARSIAPAPSSATPTPTPTLVLTPTSAPTPSPTPSPIPEPQRPFTYVVAEGDTVAGLAQRFAVSPETILWANGLAEGQALQAGQALTILPVSGVLYTVRSGDTLNAIAIEHGVDPQAIVQVNALASPDRLSAGQELVIPGGRPLPPATPTPKPTMPAESTPEPEVAVTADPADAEQEVAEVAAADPAAASRGEEIAAIAARYLGYPYVYGGASPEAGFDCSGFTQYVYAQVGLSIARGLSGQVAAGPAVAQDALAPGDLVFFENTFNAGLSHVGIYVGGGRFIHAASPERGVTTDELSLPYWATRYYSACRPW